MLQALIKGKLSREQENMEDILTSNVFGSLKYVKLENGLLPLLKNCENEKGKFLLSDFDSIQKVHFKFWPLLKESKHRVCEPDALLFVNLSNGTKLVILIEAKYLSGKSSEAIEETEHEEKNFQLNDQLAVEWDNLFHLAKRVKAIPFLLFVTAHNYFPKEEIEESWNEYSHLREEKMNVFWISWRKITKIFANSKEIILCDLVHVLKKMGLVYFERKSVKSPLKTNWSFDKKNNWYWSHYPNQKISWSFSI